MNANASCSCTVDALIENEATKWNEDDREFLSSLTSEQLEKISPVAEEEEEEEKTTPAANASKKEKKADKKKSPVANAASKTSEEEEEEDDDSVSVAKDADGNISINGKSIEDHVKNVLGKETDPVKFIDNFMPGPLKEQMKAALSLHQDFRKRTIKEIAANSDFTEKELADFSDNQLKKMHKSLDLNGEEEVSNDYSGAHGSFNSREDDEEDGDVVVNEITSMLSFEGQPAKKEEKKKEAAK